jgi:hypothetical protein
MNDLLSLGVVIGFLIGMFYIIVVDYVFESIKKSKRRLIEQRTEIIKGLCDKDKIFYQNKIREFDLKRLE